MTRAGIARAALGTVVVVLAVVAGYRALDRDVPRDADPAARILPASPPGNETHPVPESCQGFLYGRITTVDGATYEGRLRWGGHEEAFWGDYFNGSKPANPWLAQVPPERRPRERHPIAIFGFVLAQRESPSAVVRPFLARFGEIARIEARAAVVRVTLKNGAVFDLDRFAASDFDDGVRVWDGQRGVVDLDSLRIRTIDLLPTPHTLPSLPTNSLGTVPSRLYGTVRTRQGDFTGFVGWNREACVGSDELDGRTAGGRLGLRFDTLRSIARRSRASSLVTLLDGREVVLSGTADVGDGNRGIYVADPRYGQVLISWAAFERLDFRSPRAQGESGAPGDAGGIGAIGAIGAPSDTGPAYGDFPPGSPLAGSITTRDGRRRSGRLVFDLDESATTDTLDAPSAGVDYTLPFGRVAAIVPAADKERGAPRTRVTLEDGEVLQLERAGDLGPGNAGMLIFIDGTERPEYVPWTDVERVDFDRPPVIHPPLGGL